VKKTISGKNTVQYQVQVRVVWQNKTTFHRFYRYRRNRRFSSSPCNKNLTIMILVLDATMILINTPHQ
jgi:hypothetical protein